MNVRLEATVHPIYRLVPRELQGGVVLALADLVLPWTEILGRPEEEIIDMLVGFYASRAAAPAAYPARLAGTGKAGSGAGHPANLAGRLQVWPRRA